METFMGHPTFAVSKETNTARPAVRAAILMEQPENP